MSESELTTACPAGTTGYGPTKSAKGDDTDRNSMKTITTVGSLNCTVSQIADSKTRTRLKTDFKMDATPTIVSNQKLDCVFPDDSSYDVVRSTTGLNGGGSSYPLLPGLESSSTTMVMSEDQGW